MLIRLIVIGSDDTVDWSDFTIDETRSLGFDGDFERRGTGSTFAESGLFGTDFDARRVLTLFRNCVAREKVVGFRARIFVWLLHPFLAETIAKKNVREYWEAHPPARK